MPVPNPTQDHPRRRLAPPPLKTPSIHTSQSAFQLHSPSSPSPLSGRGTGTGTDTYGSPQRSLRKLASAHNLGYGSAADLRASIANPPVLIAQQRLHHQPPSPCRSSFTSSRRTSVLSPTRRNANAITASSSSSALNPSTTGTADSDALIPVVRQLTAAAAAMSSTALRNSGALNGRTAYDHIPLEKLIRDGPPDGNWDNAVECARLKVLQQEIKSDSDGMVCLFTFRVIIFRAIQKPGGH